MKAFCDVFNWTGVDWQSAVHARQNYTGDMWKISLPSTTINCLLN